MGEEGRGRTIKVEEVRQLQRQVPSGVKVVLEDNEEAIDLEGGRKEDPLIKLRDGIRSTG